MVNEAQQWQPQSFANDETVQPDSPFTALCKRLEHFETPEWAAREILRHEILTNHVVDPCVGSGVLAATAIAAGAHVTPMDIHDWGYPGTIVRDFLTLTNHCTGSTVFMNPPFSRAEEFVAKAFELGARKIICFQRSAWWESDGREEFWDKYPPNRIYICGSRATCIRHDLKRDKNGNPLDPVSGKPMGNTTTAHAWFVWEQGQPAGTLVGRIYK